MRHITKKVLSQDSLFALKVLRVFDFDSLPIYNKKSCMNFVGENWMKNFARRQQNILSDPVRTGT